MRAWRAGLVVCWLAAGCGEPFLEESPPPEALVDEAGELSAQVCPPRVGEARRVKVILPPSMFFARFAEQPESFVEFRGQLAFAINFEDRHMALWRSDGTEAGTVEVKAFPPLPSFGFDRLRGLTPAGDKLFFLASEAATGSELWVTDGTSGGTAQVADLTPGTEGSSLSHLEGLGSRLVFIRELPGPPGRVELWRSNGTTAGTQRLVDFGPDTSVSFQELRLGDTLLFFVSSAVRGTELWKTDGTAAGTGRVRRLDAGQVGIFDVRTTGGMGFFTLFDEGGLTEVWKTDGTVGGTLRLRTFGPSVFPRLLHALGAHLYLASTDAATLRMRIDRLRTDGSGVREHVVTLPNPFADQPDAFPSLNEVSLADGRIFFSMAIGTSGPAPRDTQLWVTDGTRAGTRLLRRPLSLSDEYGSPIYAVSDQLAFFTAFEAETAGIEPWVTDGTVGGTRRLKDVAPGREGSYTRSFLRVGNRLFFSAYDDTLAGQLWSVPLQRSCMAGMGGLP
ncbi:hypothetical protein [Hyalangium rubrum]|uniref:Lipoprotein n=1 Tax=Hyalangium rubrum TaxID=3103134 RepID=A0ABU5H161_9BACT|nr:hypothetical protein [Hyalangium sp. s54d21]MDY7227194.1 hypothetical protein [Hyalangium sp. s54d21]